VGAVGDARPRRLSPGAGPAGLLLAAAALAAGCGGSDPGPAEEPTRLEESLASVSASEPLGVGFGWIDVERLREGRRPLVDELGWAAGALGPGARGLAEDAEGLGRTGVDLLDADTLISTASSYTLALRLDGLDPRRAEAAFAGARAKRMPAGEWTNFDLGPDWAIPDDPRLAPLGSLAARTGVRDGQVLLARSSLARETMERADPPATDSGAIAAAASCLGDVLAARLVLNNHTHLPNSGPDLLAFGVAADPPDRSREVLCLVGEPRRVDAAVGPLERAFAPSARDGVSGEAMGDLVQDAGTETSEEGGQSVARVVITRAPGTGPGFLFGAFDRGSLLTYMGLQPPPSPGG
jgi:hypothetical protein